MGYYVCAAITVSPSCLKLTCTLEWREALALVVPGTTHYLDEMLNSKN